MTRTIKQPATYESLLSDRRTVMKSGAGAVAGAGAFGAGWSLAEAQDSTEEDDAGMATPEICVLTPQMTEGPYYLAGELIRQDITEGRPGVPLKLRIGVMNPISCTPIENVAVDIWHCDALGYYSGVAPTSPRNGDPEPEDIGTIADDNFLRGIQITDANGMVEFDTIYPGWYQGRAIHIHLKVHVGGTINDETETYEGGHTAHTGQLYFDEATNDIVFAEQPYASRVTTRLANEDDGILGDHDEEPGFMIDVSPVNDDAPADGYEGTITLGVDPHVASAATGHQGGPPSG